MLFPEVVQFAPSETVIVDRLLPELTAMGFDVSDLGGGSYAVNGIPAGTEGLNPVMLLRNIVNDAIEQGGTDGEELHVTLALSLARSAAIPLGQVLSNEEMENIVNELFACSNVNYTPDGRPILTILPQSDIDHLLA
jgi:DNA mismatch repair protein MutL